MTKEELKAEIIRCGRDPSWFIRNYVKIRHPQRGLIPFKLFDYQTGLIDSYQTHRFNVILKARQLGISEVTAAYACWLMLFHKEKNILVMATKSDTAKNIVKKVATAIKHLPKWMVLAEITTLNKLSIELNNGSQIKAITTSDDAGRSEAVSLLIVDEAAFVHNFEELWTGLLPTVTAGGRVVILSTPNGVGNMYHKLYTEAETAENDFFPTKLMWWAHPERVDGLKDDPDRPGFKTSPWFVNEIKASNMSDRDIAQELECNFNASGETVLSPEIMGQVQTGLLDPQERRHWDRNLYVWWKPDLKKRYFITCDVARGDGRDHSTAVVWDFETMEQQAEYYGRIPPEQLAVVACDLGHEYATCPLVIENNNIGLACLEHVRLSGYEAVYYSRKGDNKPGEIVNTKWGTIDHELIPGFTTSLKTRPLIIAKLEEYARNRTMIIRSKRLYEELKVFIWMNGRPEAMRGRNDDLVITAALAAWIKDTFFTPNHAASIASQQLLSGISVVTTKNTDIAGASKNPNLVPYRTMGSFAKKVDQPMRVNLPNGQVADFSWLIDPIFKG